MRKFWIPALHISLVVILLFMNSVLGINRARYVDTGFGSVRDVRDYVTPMKIDDLPEKPTALDIFNFVEKDYQYAQDDATLDFDGIILEERTDYWTTPALEMRIIHQCGHFVGDCEDGSLLVASLLRGYGYSADVYVGTVVSRGTPYDHAWVVLHENGTDYLLETIIGKQLTAFPKTTDSRIDGIYRAQYIFNNHTCRDTLNFLGGSDSIEYPTLDAKGLLSLRQRFE